MSPAGRYGVIFWGMTTFLGWCILVGEENLMVMRCFMVFFGVLLVCGSVFAGDAGEHVELRSSWADPLEDYAGRLVVSGLDGVSGVVVSYVYPGGKSGEVVGALSGESAVAGSGVVYDFVIPGDVVAQLGELKYGVKVSYGGDKVFESEGVIPLGYVEDLEITANPPEILWFALGDESATVRYTACCNILGASVIAKRIPVNPQESGVGLPERLYSDFVWLEPDALSASTAGLYFEFGFNPADFVGRDGDAPVLYEYNWRDKDWSPILHYEIVDGKVIDFPATEGGIYVLGWE
jgi:hypothetical protein